MVERTQPLLGTFVRIRVDGVPAPTAHDRIEAAFSVVQVLHRLMSFHRADSDVSRLNRDAAAAPVLVSAHTCAVLAQSLELSAASGGLFDITVAAQLVASGLLPPPTTAPVAAAGATWRDIELLDGNRVRFHRPLWIDLGGIAKGYAVDLAMRQLAQEPAAMNCVNAGGDLRVAGPWTERTLLRVPDHPVEQLPIVELRDASLASSASVVSAHIHGGSRRAVSGDQFVSVIARDCAVADALTKVVLADAAAAAAVLRRFSATAHLYDRRAGWRTLGVAA